MRALIFLLLLNFVLFSSQASVTPEKKPSAQSIADVYTAGYLADIIHQLKNSQIKFTTIKNLKINAAKSTLFSELLPEINRLLNITLPHDNLLAFINDCQNPTVDETSSSIQKEFINRLSIYCHQRFLIDYFHGKKLTTMDNLHYDQLRKWMGYYLKGEAQPQFLSLLKRLVPDSAIQREISFIITEQSISNKVYPSEEILAAIEVDRNLDLHVRRMAQTDISGKKYFSDEFWRLGLKLGESIYTKNPDLIFDLVAQLEFFYTENRELIDQEFAWKTFLYAGRKLLIKNYDNQAFNLLSFASETSNEDQKQEALFYQLIGYLLNNTPDKALAFIERNKLQTTFDKLSSKLKYWIAYTYQLNGHDKLAEDYFKNLVHNDPLTFYSIMGIKNLMKNETKEIISREQFSDQIDTKIIPLEAFNTSTQNNFSRLTIWADKHLDALASFEIQDLRNLTMNKAGINVNIFSQQDFNRSLYFYMIKTLAKHKRYLLTFKVATAALEQGALRADKTLLSMLFPTDFLPLIKRYSKLDPYLVMALIRQESAFNPEATSSVGAKGLMQLLPSTAKKFRRGANKNNLVNPSINIEAGSRYFAYLLKKFDGNLVFALAAYNAGEGRVQEWRKSNFENTNPLLMIESIPYKETRDYVKFIYRNLFYYKLLFDQLDTSSIEQSFKVSWQ